MGPRRSGLTALAGTGDSNDTVHDDGDITAAGAVGQTVVITAREDLQIAQEARRVLGNA